MTRCLRVGPEGHIQSTWHGFDTIYIYSKLDRTRFEPMVLRKKAEFATGKATAQNPSLLNRSGGR